MSITHEEARKLIQFRADDPLEGVDSNLLETHLASCRECRNYADSINELKSILQPLLDRKWNYHPLPLSAGQTSSGRSKKLTQHIFFATRIAAMGVICIAFLFNIWQFTQSGRQRSGLPSAAIPLIPTPSMQSATSRVTDQTCEPILYQVGKNDTLETIANRFSIPSDEIIRVNHLRTLALDTSMNLSIPVCSPTPSGTPNNLTGTFTPLLGSTTLTPAKHPTQ